MTLGLGQSWLAYHACLDPMSRTCFGFRISTERFDGRFKAGLRYKALASSLLIYLLYSL